MFNKIKSLYLVIFLMGVFCLNAQNTFQIKDINSTIPVDPSIKIGKLPNGITYYIKKNSKPENRMELRLALKAGAMQEDANQNGLAHFVEHMAFNGTKSFPKSELISYLESIGIEFGNDLNAYTSYDETVYMLKVPTDNKEQMKKGIQVLEEWAHQLAFEPVEIDKERGVIIEEWRLGKGADDRVQRKHNPIIYYNSKYAKHDVIGDTAILKNFKHETLTKFYKDWYRPDLMAVIVVGDFDMVEVEKMVVEYFSKIEPKKDARKRETIQLPEHKQTLVSVATDKELAFPSIQLMMKYKADEKGTYKDYRQNIVHTLVTTMINKRIEERQTKPNPPFGFFAVSYSGNFVPTTDAFGFFGMLKSDNVEQGVNATFTELFRAAQHGFNESELIRVKNEQLRFMENALLEKDKTESINYASEFVRNFLQKEAIPGIENELQMYKLWLPEITIAEINTEIKKLVKKENTVIAISTPERAGVVTPTEKQVLDMFNLVASQNHQPYIDDAVTKPLFSKDVKPGKVVSSKQFKNIGVTELTLSNGIKVVLKPTEFKNDEVMFSSFRFGGSSTAPDADYHTSAIAGTVLSESGVSEFSNTDLSKLLSGKMVDVRASIRELEEAISGQCSPQDIEEMFQLIHLRVTEPRQDVEAFSAYIEKTASSIKDDENDPRTVFYDSISAVMHSYHPRRMPWKVEDLTKVNLLKAIKFYKSRFENMNGFNFFFVGNFNVEKITPMIEKYIGSLPSTNKTEKFTDLGIKIPKGKIEKVIKKGIEKQSMVNVRISGDFDFSGNDKFLLNAALDAFNIRLREVIREEKSGTYGAYGYANAAIYPRPVYTINIGFGCDPDRSEELYAEIIKLINEFTSKQLDDSYNQKVKEQLLKSLEVSMQDNRYWMNNLYSAYYNNENPEKIAEKKKEIESLTSEKLFEISKKYFKLDNVAKFVLYPEK